MDVFVLDTGCIHYEHSSVFVIGTGCIRRGYTLYSVWTHFIVQLGEDYSAGWMTVHRCKIQCFALGKHRPILQSFKFSDTSSSKMVGGTPQIYIYKWRGKCFGNKSEEIFEIGFQSLRFFTLRGEGGSMSEKIPKKFLKTVTKAACFWN